MNNAQRALRGGLRAATGLIVLGAAAAGTVLVTSASLPTLRNAPLSVTASTQADAVRSIVCAGSFAELGANPRTPDAAVPTGTAAVTQVGSTDEKSELKRDVPGGTAPMVLRASGANPLGAAQTQTLDTATLRGLTATACVEPANEQWLVGGSTALGSSSTVTVGNPNTVPATVKFSLFDTAGEVASSQTVGVLVPPGAERTVALNGFAPGRDGLAVRVESTGASVTAALGLSQTEQLSPKVADIETRQLAPSTRLVIPGPANISGEDMHGDGDGGSAGDSSGMVVRVLAPGRDGGTATVRALRPKGGAVELGTVKLKAGALGQLKVAKWPADATAVVVTSDVPVVGGVLGTASAGGFSDGGWFAPAPEIAAGTTVAVPIVADGQLVIANDGDSTATVSLGQGDGKQTSTVSVPAGAAVIARAPKNAQLISDQPVSAGVRVVKGSGIAGYPIMPGEVRARTITVFTD